MESGARSICSGEKVVDARWTASPGNGHSPAFDSSIEDRIDGMIRKLLAPGPVVGVLGVAAVITLSTFTSSAAVPPPKLKYEILSLPNGLTTILSEDHSTPIVHVTLWYHVGSKNEKKGRTGFAHLFEHLMFKGSRNVEPEGHTSMISSIGGQANAYTEDDVTVFWETVPSQYLPLSLWLEADRMAAEDQPGDVCEQARGREGRAADAGGQPAVRPPQQRIIYGRRSRRIRKHATIGSVRPRGRVGRGRARFLQHVRPENATLTIVGDFDMAQARDR